MERMREVHFEVPATVSNLGPGFDCFGMAVDLVNRVRARPAPGWCMRTSGEWGRQLPSGPENLLRRAYERAAQHFGLELPALDVHVDVAVPPGRGLGSSATAVAAGLALAARMARHELPELDLAALGAALEGHPDNVVPALFGGLCLCLPDGAHLRFEPPSGLRLVALSPANEVSTEAARRALPRTVPLEHAVFNLGHASLLAAALVTGRLEAIRELELLADRLHQPVRGALIPGLGEAIEAGHEAGALGVCISGSGPTVLALCGAGGEEQAVAAAVSAALERKGTPVSVRLLAPRAAGALRSAAR
jgi:homoserine kinase